MFFKIFLFEIQNRVRRPAIYLYFLAILIFTIGSFATGSLPIGEKEHINSPYLISFWCAAISMMMMLVTSSVMGIALYRDIEYNTKDYYLTYPITKAGYFWGRYAGSFVCMLFIASAILIGIYAGSKLGPRMGWKDIKEYGPNELSYYLWPFFTIALPNIFFTSSLFFGLVAITRNVKVIYTGGILLFLGYFLSVFFLSNTNNATVINLADAFGLNGIRMEMNNASAMMKNTTLFPIKGTVLINRLLWPGAGMALLLYTYWRFDFESFFSGKRDKASIDEVLVGKKRFITTNVKPVFTGSYNRSTMWDLTRLEISNIMRDNYFWIILSAGMVFLGFVFWMGNHEFGVPDFPRTVLFFEIFLDTFPFFIFFIIIFYTGETLFRDRSTRYSFINDSLPPPNWVMNGSKLIALLIMAAVLAIFPLLVAMIIQTAKGFYHYNFSAYATGLFIIVLPRLFEMVFFSYMLHVVVNNKFAAYGIGIVIWVLMFFFQTTGTFDYNLVLYSYTPGFRMSDMDGAGHMITPVNWFNLYWLLAGSILIIIAALFYNRGISSSFKERLQLVRERFDSRTRLFAVLLIIPFLAVGGYVWYNVSYLNNFLTKTENENRAILYEKTLKPYQSLPLPKITHIELHADLFPATQQMNVKALVKLLNKTNQPIDKMLLDADGLTSYTIFMNGARIPYTCPLTYKRGIFNWFRPSRDTAEFRLYTLPERMMPGDSAAVEIYSSIFHNGFSNGLYGANLLHNGVFMNLGLPGLGYDDDDEIGSPYVRKRNGLPPKMEEEIAQDDSRGINNLKAGSASDLLTMDFTISTDGDQTAIAPGKLEKQWKENGRNYFHYVQNNPGMYPPAGIMSAKYALTADSIQLEHNIHVFVYHHPEHNANVRRFIAGYKAGLRYYSKAYGNYPFGDICLAETPVYGPRSGSMTGLDSYAEYYSWNAHFTDPNQFDYCYYNASRELAQQWWRFQVAPNNTAGGLVIPEGLANYCALVLSEKKYGKDNIKGIVQDQLWFYLFIRHRMNEPEHPLIRADQWYEWGGKAGVVLYGLKDLIGEDSINAALRDFKQAYAFKSKGPFAGTNDLYRYLQKHTPDSLQYYLIDNFEKITLYDNKILDAKATATGHKDEYKVDFTVDVAKVWIDNKGNENPATKMNDYIDIGILGANTNNKEGRSQANTLYLQKYKLSAGHHSFSIIVKGKPAEMGIDPFAKLIDRQPNDNMRGL
jgi:ABC-2 type transport system permease protein